MKNSEDLPVEIHENETSISKIDNAKILIIENYKKISLSLYGLIIICFSLPFISFSCGGQDIAAFSGIDLIKGASFGDQKSDPNIAAIIALIAVIIGIGCILLKGKLSSIMASITGIIGVVSLFVMRIVVEKAVQEEGEGIIMVNWEVGYYLSLLFFLGIFIYNIFILSNKKDWLRNSGNVNGQTNNSSNELSVIKNKKVLIIGSSVLLLIAISIGLVVYLPQMREGDRMFTQSNSIIVGETALKPDTQPNTVKESEIQPIIQAYLYMLTEVTGCLDPWSESPDDEAYARYFHNAYEEAQCLHADYISEEKDFWIRNYYEFEQFRGGSVIEKNELIRIDSIVPDKDGNLTVTTSEKWQIMSNPHAYPEETISRKYVLKKDKDQKWKIVKTDKNDLILLIKKDAPVWKIKASSTLRPGTTLKYDPDLVYDNDPSTAWVEGKSDEGIGEWIMFELPQGTYTYIKKIEIMNGYQASKELFYNNNRIKKLRLDVTGEIERKSWYWDLEDCNFGQTITLSVRDESIGDVNSLTITIMEVYKGNKYNDTCISEISFQH